MDRFYSLQEKVSSIHSCQRGMNYLNWFWVYEFGYGSPELNFYVREEHQVFLPDTVSSSNFLCVC